MSEVDSNFGERHHHFYHHHHLGFGGPHVVFEWLPLLAGMLVTVAVAWMLLGDDRFGRASRAFTLPRHDSVRQRWHGAVCSHAVTAQQFAAYECDPSAVLRHPDLADVTRPATALFIDAFADANALSTHEYPGVKHAERFIDAAQRAQRTWRDAVDAAQRSGPTWIERRSAHQPARRPVHIERHTDWLPIPPGRHRAQAPGPRHARLEPLSPDPAPRFGWVRHPPTPELRR